MEYVEKVRPSIITASGQDYMDAVIKSFEEFQVVAQVDYREDLLAACNEWKPDILVVSDNIGGKSPLHEILASIKIAHPTIRIVYFYGKVDFSDTISLKSLNMLISLGIYDIITESSIEVELIKFVLKNPRTIENVDFLQAKNMESIHGKRKSNITVTKSANDIQIESGVYRNLSTFMSTKGGVGKTFLVSNIAVAIAATGINTPKGSKPRIGILDLDLAGFSATDIFKTANKEKNIIMASIEAQKIIKKDGTLNDNKSLKKEVIDKIRKMFVQSPKYSNIYVLGAPEREFYENDSFEFTNNDIVFIIESVIDDFDVLLVDMNSDWEYSKVFPLFSMSRDIYNVIDMDFRAFYAQKRQIDHILEYASEKKIKYILNRKLDDSKTPITADEIEKILEYKFISKIPNIAREDIFDIDFKEEFLIMAKGSKFIEARYEIIKTANDIWPIKNFDRLAQKMESIFNKKEAIVQEEKQITGKENKFTKFIKDTIGLEDEEVDVIKEGLKNNKSVQSFSEITSKIKKAVTDTINNFGESSPKSLSDEAKEVEDSSENEDVKQIEDSSNESDGGDE